jgi:hypothetical protein
MVPVVFIVTCGASGGGVGTIPCARVGSGGFPDVDGTTLG